MKRGRPKLPAAERRQATIIVRLQAKDRAAAEKKAKAKNIILSEWVREVIVAATDDRPGVCEQSKCRCYLRHGPIQLQIEGTMTREQWERLKKFVEILEPSEETE